MKKIKQNTSNGVNKKIIFLTIFAAFLLIPFISKAAVVINEVLYDPSSSTDTGKEYIILYNNGGSPYIMDSHCLYASDKHYIFKSFTLEPKKQIIIHWNTEGTDTSTDLYTGTTNWSNMGNSSGSVALFLNHTEHESSIIDFIRYHAAGSTENKTWESAAAKAGIWAKGDFIPDVDAGYAIKLKTDGLDNNSSNDWMSATPSITQEESSSSQQQSATQQISANSQPPVADAGDDVIAFIGDEITFDGSKSYDPDGFDLACEWNLGEGGVENDVAVTHKYSYPGTYLVTLTVFDGKYYVSDTITIEIYPKKITINEFLPSPTGKDEEEEWIELYNDSDQIIDLSGWQLDDEDNSSKPFVFPKNTLIAPNGYLVFPRTTTKIALNNDKDKVRLLLSSGTVFQEISYEKAPQGKSSARTSEGFVWAMPTPGFANIVGPENQKITDAKPMQSETTGYASQNIALTSQNNLKNSISGGWVYLNPQGNQSQNNNQLAYNLAAIQRPSGASNKTILIILTIIILAVASILLLLKLKKKI